MITCKNEKLDPEKAARWLELNIGNRPIYNKDIAAYAADMKNGKWLPNGQTIIFDANGHMRNGQHRCHAVIASGATIDVMVARGVDPESFSTMDRQRARSLADYLTIKGRSNCSAMSGAIAWVYRFENNKMDTGNGRSATGTRTDLEGIEHRLGDKIAESVQATHNMRVAKLIGPSMAAAFHYIFSTVGSLDEANEFFGALSTGDGLKESHPISKLRNRLIDNAASKAKLGQGYVASLIVKTWNAIRTNKSVGVLRSSYGEPFPEVL